MSSFHLLAHIRASSSSPLSIDYHPQNSSNWQEEIWRAEYELRVLLAISFFYSNPSGSLVSI